MKLPPGAEIKCPLSVLERCPHGEVRLYYYCNIDNLKYDMHLFTYLLPHGDFAKIIMLGSLIPLLVPISIEPIVI